MILETTPLGLSFYPGIDPGGRGLVVDVFAVDLEIHPACNVPLFCKPIGPKMVCEPIDPEMACEPIDPKIVFDPLLVRSVHRRKCPT